MIRDSVLNNRFFDHEDTSVESYEKCKENLAKLGIFLPKVTYSEPKLVVTLGYDRKTKAFHQIIDENTIGPDYKDLRELYDYYDHSKVDIDFDESILDSPVTKGSIGLDFISIKSKKRNFSRVLISVVDKKQLDVFHYFKFLCLAKKWIADKDNWVLAYNFIGRHPVFWHRTRTDKFEHEWVLDDGYHSLWTWVTTKDGKPVVCLEHGSSVPPNHDHYYHDTRLDVYGDTFEDAYIKLAKKIHQYFTIDGEEREE